MRHPTRIRQMLAATAATLALLALPTAASAHDGGFSDVPPGGVHSADIDALHDQGVLDGTLCGEEEFCPREPLTRAHMAVWMVRIVDGADPALVAATRFSDVVGDHRHAAFIERLAELNITYGCETNPLRYCPDEPVSRAQMASFLARAFELSAAESAGFVDVVAGGAHSADIDALAASGITYGCETEPLRFCPRDDVTRAQMASFLVRASAAPAVAGVSEPLERCATDWYGAGQMSVLVGTTADGFYEPVVVIGGAGACEQIKAAWDDIRAAEATRIAEGQYPCEYAAAYNYWPLDEVQTNGPAMLVGCWPRILRPGDVYSTGRRADPDQEALRLWNREGFWILPPNDPPMIEALYGCYRDALQGPPPGWEPATPAGGWVTVNVCNSRLDAYGNPVRSLGVTPACAAEQYAGRIAERKAVGFIGKEFPWEDGTGSAVEYDGDYSWANCATSASRLLDGHPAESGTYSQRCEAVVDAAAGVSTFHTLETWQLAQNANTTVDRVIAVVKAMFCEDGTRDTVRGQGRAYQAFVPHWVDSYADFVALWMPPEGSVCYEAAILEAARKATHGAWGRVLYC